MNPVNLSNMGMQSMGPQGIPQQGVQHRPANPAQAAPARIFQLIQMNQQQFPIQGWQATLPIQQRATNVFQIFSQVRLIKNDMTIDNAIQVAIQFEQKTFQDSPDRGQYDQKCRSKMEDIAKTRNQLAKSMQQQLQNGQNAPANMLQQQMQMQGFPNLNQQQLLQQQQQQQQQQMQQRLMQQQQQSQTQGMAMQPQAQMQMGNPQSRMQGMPSNMPQSMQIQQQQPPPPPKYTPQEQQEIQRKIQELYSTVSRNPEHMKQLGSVLQQNNPNAPVRNLMQIHFQQQAIRWFEEAKKMSTAPRAGQLMPGSQGASGPQQGRSVSQESGRLPNQQSTPVSAPQSFDPSFIGTVDQMRLNALRSQEAGQVVVPASQTINQPQRAIGGAPQTNPQNAANRPVQTPQVPQQPPQMWNQQNGQSQQQGNIFTNGMNGVPQNLLQGQTGGLNTAARTPQQNANMPNLNRAFGPQAAQPNMQPQQITPQMTQQNQMNPQQFLHNGVPRPPPGMTQQQFQQMVQQMPEAERKALLMKMQASQAQKQRQQNGQGISMQAQRNQQGQSMPSGPQPAQNPQLTPRSAQQKGPQQPPVNGQPQQSQAQPQRNALQNQQQRAAIAANSSLTNEQEQQMDMYPYPTGILNAGNALSQLPPSIKTWGQLKQWVKMNSASVPGGSEQKLRGLQGLHYQSLQQPKKGMPPQAMRNAAPPAQMTPRPNQPPVNPQIPQPSPQEIANLRGKHPQLAGLTDEQIRGMVMKQRTQDMMRRREEQLQMMQQRQAAQNQPQPQPQAMQIVQPHQAPPEAQRPIPQQTPKMGAQAKNQPAPTAQLPAQSPAMQKGVKRGSSDDVVEVPNPNINQQRPQPKPQPKAPAANMGQIPQKPAEVEKVQAMQREKSNAKPPQLPAQSQAKTAEAIKSEERFMAILAEVRKDTPQRQPVPMDADTRRKMLEKLASARELITRMGQFLPTFYKVFNDENALRNLSRVYLTLAQQYRNEQVKLASPIEHFTIGLEELDSNINTLKGYFNTTMDRMTRQKSAAQKAAESMKESTPALSAANLQQHQNNMKLQREASMKKESNRAPPAPTSAQPPNPWGPSSPHGVPAAYGPNQLTQDKLQLPAKKKIKNNNSAASTPAHLHGTPIPAASPLVTKSPEMQKTPAPVILKCPVQNCSEIKLFANQIELDKHMVEHETKEPIIDDPFKFTLDQMQLALNLDKNGKAKPKPEPDAAEATKMKQSALSRGMKQESATPMSRVPTGPSPASHLKTPQPAKSLLTSSNMLPDVILPDDPWADTLIRPEIIQEAFSPLSTLSGPRTWTKIQDYLTPESTSDSTDPSKSSPRLSDVSENDAVKISMDMGISKNWIPVNWMDADLRAGMDDFELLDLNIDTGHEAMDWETLFDEPEEEALARITKERARVEKELERGGTGVTEAFASIYGPGEMEPKRR